jgi:cytidine deaminase
MDYKELIKKAYEAMEYSYSPYSNFRVGAALLLNDGSVYTGCNIESASFGATNCAERTAIFKAVSEGKKDFKAIAIVSDMNEETFPCGICRQVMAEFSHEMEIVLGNREMYKVYSFNEIMPYSFTQIELNKGRNNIG